MTTLLGWLLLAGLAGFFIYMLTNKQKGSALGAAAMRANASAIGNPVAGVVAQPGSPSAVQVPPTALSNGPTGRPICEAPLDPCVGAVQNGMYQGDPQLFPGSYMPARYYNTGAFVMGCGEMPTNCLNC